MQRNTTVDLARLLASFGVVAIHVHNSTPTAQAIGDSVWPLCVPFFYSASLTYFVAGLSRSPTSITMARAWTRLIIPYLVWTAIYTTLLLAKHLLVGQHNPLIWWAYPILRGKRSAFVFLASFVATASGSTMLLSAAIV